MDTAGAIELVAPFGIRRGCVCGTVAARQAGDRRRAVVVGGSITVFILLAAGVSALILETTIKAPYFVSFAFLAIIVAMSFELSRDLLRSAQLAGQLQASEGALRESERRMELAASAAELGLWVWEIESDAIWATDKTRALLGFGKDEPLDFGRFVRRRSPGGPRHWCGRRWQSRSRTVATIAANTASSQDGHRYAGSRRGVVSNSMRRDGPCECEACPLTSRNASKPKSSCGKIARSLRMLGVWR